MQKIEIKQQKKLNFHISEAYKTLRTNVQLCGEDIKVVALTSCTPNEGKTSISFQLAQSMAEDGKKVLFIDADVRKSVLVGRYQMTTKHVKGLTHYLSGQSKLTDVICQTNVEGLDVILTGPVPPNPSELLGGKYFKELIATQREKYDIIVLDTPPLGSVIDSVVVARQCDGIMLVIAAEEVSYKFAMKVKEQLEVADCKILGVVRNKLRFKTGGKYYGKYYGHYENEEEEDDKIEEIGVEENAKLMNEKERQNSLNTDGNK